MLTASSFLDIRQKSLVENFFRSEKTGVRHIFYGGYDDAERCIAVFLPDYLEEYRTASDLAKMPDSENPLTVIRAVTAKGSRQLTHRDYLGSLLSLGIKREVTGDILVRENGADIIVLNELADFLLLNYEKAGRTGLTLSRVPVSELMMPETRTEEIRESVASMRLDNIVSAAFGLSRQKAADAINAGIVFVNNSVLDKPDKPISEGDKVVLRGKGKIVIKELAGKSRKDRLYVIFERYL